MDALAFTPAGILPPTPNGKRAQRTKWSFKPQKAGTTDKVLCYGTQKNVVIRDMNDPKKTWLLGEGVEGNVTCVKYSPSTYYVAFGDDKGAVQVLGWSPAENGWVVKYENANLFGGAVADLAWSEDSKKILAVGAGNTRAAMVSIDGGTKAGDIIGHNGTLLTCDIKPTKPPKAVVSGEDMEIQVYKGIPMKPEKSIQKAHAGFINKVGFTKTDGGAHFVAVSGDKNVSVYDTATAEVIFMQPCEHAQGINDFAFSQNENEIVTVSSDRTVRVHGIDFEGKALEHR